MFMQVWSGNIIYFMFSYGTMIRNNLIRGLHVVSLAIEMCFYLWHTSTKNTAGVNVDGKEDLKVLKSDVIWG